MPSLLPLFFFSWQKPKLFNCTVDINGNTKGKPALSISFEPNGKCITKYCKLFVQHLLAMGTLKTTVKIEGTVDNMCLTEKWAVNKESGNSHVMLYFYSDTDKTRLQQHLGFQI